MRLLTLGLALTLGSSPTIARAGQPWEVERSQDYASRRPTYTAHVVDPVTGGRLMFRCAGGMAAVLVALPDPTNWPMDPGTRAVAYVQVGSGPTDTYEATVVVKREGFVVYDVEAPGLAPRMTDGEVRVMVPRNSERPLATFDTSGDATALEPVRTCGR